MCSAMSEQENYTCSTHVLHTHIHTHTHTHTHTQSERYLFDVVANSNVDGDGTL
jgi:hypothetical protein